MFFAKLDFASQIREQGKSATGNIDTRKLRQEVHKSLHVSYHSSFDLSRANSFWRLINAVECKCKSIFQKTLRSRLLLLRGPRIFNN